MTTRPCNAVGCTNQAAALYLTGPRCTRHTPAAMAGRPEVTPDPTRTLTGLRAAAGRPDVAPPLVASQLNDDRAILSGKRRSTEHQYRDAQMRAGITP